MSGTSIKLLPPSLKGDASVEESISRRRSIRKFKDQHLSLSQLSQILWSVQDITSINRQRAIPSAGATYPLEVFASVGKQTVEGLKAGIYHYEIDTHSLSLHLRDDMRQKLAEAALSQSFIATASVNIVICALFSRTSYRYGKRGERYVHMEETEAGHAGQKISLQAIALGMATILIGAFDDEEIRKVLEIEGQIEPLYIIPIGKPL